MALTPEDLEYIKETAGRRIRSLGRMNSAGKMFDWETGTYTFDAPWLEEEEDRREERRSILERLRRRAAETRDRQAITPDYGDPEQAEHLADRREQLQRERDIARAAGEEGVLERSLGIFSAAARGLDFLGAAARSGVKEGVDFLTAPGTGEASLGDFRRQLDEREGAGTLFFSGEDDDTDGVLESIAQGAAGFTGDVLLDPLTYLTLGGSVVGRRALGEAAEAGAGRIAQRAVGALDDAGRRGLMESVDPAMLRQAVADRADDELSATFGRRYRNDLLDELADDSGRGVDEVLDTVNELRPGFRDEVVDELAARGFQARVGSQATRHGARGIRRTIVDTLGEGNEELAGELFAEMPDAIRGGLGVRLPFGTRSANIGRRLPLERRIGGGGKVLDNVPGLRGVANTMDAVRAGLRAAASGPLARIRGQLGDVESTALKALLRDEDEAARGWSLWQARREAREETQQVMRRLKTRDEAAIQTARAALRTDGVDAKKARDAAARFVQDRGRADDVAEELLAQGYDEATVAAGRQAAGQLAGRLDDYGRTAARLVNESMFGPEGRNMSPDSRLLNNYFPRWLSKSEELQRELAPNRRRGGGGAKTGSQGRLTHRSGAFAEYEQTPDGSFRVARWLTADEANELAGRELFEEDAFDSLGRYFGVMTRFIEEHRTIRDMRAAGVLLDAPTEPLLRVGQDTLRNTLSEVGRRQTEARASLRDAMAALQEGDERPLQDALAQMGRRVDDETFGPTFRRVEPGVYEGPEVSWNGDGAELVDRVRVLRDGDGWRVDVPDTVAVDGQVPQEWRLSEAQMARVARAGELQAQRVARAEGRLTEAQERLSEVEAAFLAAGERGVRERLDVEARKLERMRSRIEIEERVKPEPKPEVPAPEAGPLKAVRENGRVARYETSDGWIARNRKADGVGWEVETPAGDRQAGFSTKKAAQEAIDETLRPAFRQVDGDAAEELSEEQLEEARKGIVRALARKLGKNDARRIATYVERGEPFDMFTDETNSTFQEIVEELGWSRTRVRVDGERMVRFEPPEPAATPAVREMIEESAGEAGEMAARPATADEFLDMVARGEIEGPELGPAGLFNRTARPASNRRVQQAAARVAEAQEQVARQQARMVGLQEQADQIVDAPDVFRTRDQAQAAALAATAELVSERRMTLLRRMQRDALRQVAEDEDRLARALEPEALPVDPQEQRQYMESLLSTVRRYMPEQSNQDVRRALSERRQAATRYRTWLKDNGYVSAERPGAGQPVTHTPQARASILRKIEEEGLFSTDGISHNVARMFPERGRHQESLARFVDGFWAPTFALFKTLATVGRGPGYVARNVLGGSWNAWLLGVSPSNMRTASAVMGDTRRARQEVLDSLSGDETPEQVVTRVESAIRDRLVGRFGDERGANVFDALRQFHALGLGGATRTTDVLTVATQGGVSGSVSRLPGAAGSRALREAEAPFLETIGEGRRNLFVGQNRRDLSRMQRGANRLADNGWIRFMTNNRFIGAANSEEMLRLGTFLKGADDFGLEDGGVAASLLVKQSQFDYQDLSDFEQRVLKNWIPFYTFTRHNVPLQFRALMTDPGKMNRLANFQDNLELALGAEDQDEHLLPDWVRERMGFVSRFNPQGTGPITIGVESPAMDLNRLFQVHATWNPMAWVNWREVANMAGPQVKVPVETLSGTSMFTGAPLPDDDTLLGIPVNTSLGNAVRQTLPTVGQLERLVTGPANPESRYRDRALTSWASQMAAAPVSTLDLRQEAGATYGELIRIREQLRERLGDDYDEDRDAIRDALSEGWSPGAIRSVLGR